jgi:uncharacterized radical SAM protein YgiQ
MSPYIFWKDKLVGMEEFLVVSKKDMRRKGWDTLDFVLVTGDAYVDHHSFGAAVIGRVLEKAGYKVGILAQPYFQDERDMDKLGEPRLGFLVTSGNMDSMVAHYSVNKKRRHEDAYSPGGNMGHRPDRAVTVYSQLIRKRYPDANIVLGGIEASLRRFAHYDYWDNKIMPSILEEAEANLLTFGMGENVIVQIAEFLNQGFTAGDIQWLPGTCYLTSVLSETLEEQIEAGKAVQAEGYREVRRNPQGYNQAFLTEYNEQDPVWGRTVVQRQKNAYLVQNPPGRPLERAEMDAVYELPFSRKVHPSYLGQGGIPAIEEVRFSITASRGCFGSCSFCAITFHQGRIVTSRSKDSLLAEAARMIGDEEFKGYIHDVGGPTANFFGPACDKQLSKGSCSHRQCLVPEPCENLNVTHDEYLDILRAIRSLPGVKKVFVRSGIRYDYLMADANKAFLKELCAHHVSGRLKVAPEHVSPSVLEIMGKPTREVYDAFCTRFKDVNRRLGKDQHLVPYLISSHPGSRLSDAIILAEYLRDQQVRPEQVQDFYPVPGTLSTAMYHTGRNPLDGKELYVAKSPQDKKMQRALLQYFNRENHALVRKALRLEGREDLIGNDKKCLVPAEMKGAHTRQKVRKKPQRKR